MGTGTEIIQVKQSYTDDIKEIDNGQKENIIYNLWGQSIVNTTKKTNHLPKGIYIVNGKKYIIK